MLMQMNLLTCEDVQLGLEAVKELERLGAC